MKIIINTDQGDSISLIDNTEIRLIVNQEESLIVNGFYMEMFNAEEVHRDILKAIVENKNIYVACLPDNDSKEYSPVGVVFYDEKEFLELV